MPRPIIYQLPHSPYCIPITKALESLHVSYSTVNIKNGDRSLLIKLSKGKSYQVPILKYGQKVIYEDHPDSQNISRFVDKEFASGKLFPRNLDGIQKLIIPYLENDVEGVTFKLQDPGYVSSIKDLVDRTMIIRHKERRFGVGCLDLWKKQRHQLLQAAEEKLIPFEEMLINSPFLLGFTPVYSDFLLFGILGNLVYQKRNQIPTRLKRIKAWYNRMSIYLYP